MFLHLLVGGSRVPNGKSPLRGQGTKRGQDSRETGGNSHGDKFYGNLHNLQRSESRNYGSEFASLEVDGSFHINWYLLFTPMDAAIVTTFLEVNPTSINYCLLPGSMLCFRGSGCTPLEVKFNTFCSMVVYSVEVFPSPWK